ncbi:hypothetical protein NPIL_342081, partial [Nephila pilipes]
MMSTTNLRKMIERFESTRTVKLNTGRGRKGIKQQQVEEVATAVVVQEKINVH